MKHMLLLAALLSSFQRQFLLPNFARTGDIMPTVPANCALMAHTQPHHDVLWLQTVITFRTTGADRNWRRMGDISPIPVPWFCAQMATTIQAEAVGYFQMADTLVLNELAQLNFITPRWQRSGHKRILGRKGNQQCIHFP